MAHRLLFRLFVGPRGRGGRTSSRSRYSKRRQAGWMPCAAGACRHGPEVPCAMCAIDGAARPPTERAAVWPCYSVSATARRCRRSPSSLFHTLLAASCCRAFSYCDRRAIGRRSLLFLLRRCCTSLPPPHRRPLCHNPSLLSFALSSPPYRRVIGRRLLPALLFCSSRVHGEM